MPPCETPALIFSIPDVDELYCTWKYLSVRYDLSKLNKEEEKNCLSLNCKPSCQTLSNAYETSKKIQEQYSFFPRTQKQHRQHDVLGESCCVSYGTRTEYLGICYYP
jgi:hypothetical protein